MTTKLRVADIMYQAIVNAIKHAMPDGGEITGYGRGNRTWLFQVTWPEQGIDQNVRHTNKVFVRIEHDLIEAEDEFVRECAEYRIQQFLKYHFQHYVSCVTEDTSPQEIKEVWCITRDILVLKC